MSRKGWVASLALVVAVACSKSSSDGAPASAAQTCDPLSATASPIALTDVLAAGKASDGKIFVIDRGGQFKGLRAFVSDGTVLRRHKIVGSGEGPDFVSVQLDDANTGTIVKVDLVNGAATRMGISGQRDPGSKTFDIGNGEELTMIPTSDLASFSVADLATMRIEYAATTQDGHRLFVVSPEIDFTDDKVRVFYGTPDRVVERRIVSIARTRGGILIVRFDLEGTPATATLVFCLAASQGPPKLEPEGGPIIPLTAVPGSPGGVRCPSLDGDAGDSDAGSGLPDKPAPPAELVAGLTFVCF